MFYLSAFLGFVCLCIVSVIRKHREQTRSSKDGAEEGERANSCGSSGCSKRHLGPEVRKVMAGLQAPCHKDLWKSSLNC